MEIRRTGRVRGTVAEAFFANIHRSVLPAFLPLWLLALSVARRLHVNP